jgi:hypothetical protein
MARFLLNNYIVRGKASCRLSLNIREFLPKGHGWDVMAQYTKKMLTFIINQARIEYYPQFIQESGPCRGRDNELCLHPWQQRNNFV